VPIKTGDQKREIKDGMLKVDPEHPAGLTFVSALGARCSATNMTRPWFCTSTRGQTDCTEGADLKVESSLRELIR
jgi:hypothetical protein